MATPQSQLPAGFEEVSITPAFLDQEAKKFGLSKSSGYRSTLHNKAVGGVPSSYHLKGEAGDYVGTPEQKKKFYSYLKDNYKYELKELLNEGSHIHAAATGIPEGFEEVSAQSSKATPSVSGDSKDTYFKEAFKEQRAKRLVPPKVDELTPAERDLPIVGPLLGRFRKSIPGRVVTTAAEGVGLPVMAESIKALLEGGPVEQAKHTLMTLKGMGETHWQELVKAKELMQAAGYSDLGVALANPNIAQHLLAAVVPLVGPYASSAVDDLKAGRMVEGMTKAGVILAPFGLKTAKSLRGKLAKTPKEVTPLTVVESPIETPIEEVPKPTLKKEVTPSISISKGDKVSVKNIKGTFEVVDTSDPASITIKTSKGVEFKAGRKTIENVSKPKGVIPEGFEEVKPTKTPTEPKTEREFLSDQALQKRVDEAKARGEVYEGPEDRTPEQQAKADARLKEMGFPEPPIKTTLIAAPTPLSPEALPLPEQAAKAIGRSLDELTTQERLRLKKEFTDTDLDTAIERIKPFFERSDKVHNYPKSKLSPEAGVITPQLANYMSLGLAKFVERDIGGNIIGRASRIGHEVLEFLVPRRGVPKEGLDIMSRLRGSRAHAEARFRLWGEEVKRAFDKAPNDENVAFMDRIKTGQSQGLATLKSAPTLGQRIKQRLLNRPLSPDKQLQDIADFYRTLDDEVITRWNQARKAAGLDESAYLENHFRIFWEKIPGAPTPVGFVAKAKALILPKRPLTGTKGMLKKHTLTDVSEGIAKGGVPISYNPQVLMEMSYADGMKYATALDMWNDFKTKGLRKFVKLGQDIPQGFRPISDPIAQVYFKTKPGLVKKGQWVVEENVARILENHLSRDYFRESEAGSAIADVKNTITMSELGLSGFHGVFEWAESSGSAIGLGLRQFVNVGLMQGKPSYLLKGGKSLAKGLTGTSAYTSSRLGGSVIRMIKNESEFLTTTRGQSFINTFPAARQLIGDLFAGGAQIKMAEGYRTHWLESMKTEWKEGNVPGAALRAFPTGIEQLMLPLFDNFIPKLKIGTFLEEYSTALVENKKALASGKMTRPELAGKTWDFIEDRFGEMNFDNLYWKNTFKTTNQVLFRSVTWQLGNLRATMGALPQQAFEVGKSLRQGNIPKLTPKFSWAAGMSLNTVILSSIITKSTTGKYPWELASNAADVIYQVIYPRISKDDPSKRISTPTYWRAAAHAFHDPKGYITSTISSPIHQAVDIWQNKDFFGDWIYNPSDPIQSQTMDAIKYVFPTPFSVKSFKNAFTKGEPLGEALEGTMGITKAPYYIREPQKAEVYRQREEQRQYRRKLLKESAVP